MNENIIIGDGKDNEEILVLLKLILEEELI